MAYRAQRHSPSGPLNQRLLNSSPIGVYSSCAEVRSIAYRAVSNDAAIIKNRGLFLRTQTPANDTGDELTGYITLVGGFGFQFINTAYTNFTYLGTPPYDPGSTFWDGNSLNARTEFDDVTIQLGEENQILCVNDENFAIQNGAPVYASGAQGQRLAIKLFANGLTFASRILGLVTHNVEAHQNCRVTSFGIVRDLPTLGLTVGAPIYTTAVAGVMSQTKPDGDVEASEMGIVMSSHPNNGSIFVHPEKLSRLAGTTANRPTNPRKGDFYLDTTISRPIWWLGAAWVDSTGTPA